MSTSFVTTCDRCGEPIRRWSQLVVWCEKSKAQTVNQHNKGGKRHETGSDGTSTDLA
jgi:predicted nucleic acid-binding Zn ribbon protein